MALDGLPRFTGMEDLRLLGGAVDICPSPDYVEQAYDDAKYGGFSKPPAMEICVVPSESEGCSRVLIEAMALAKPVFGTDTGGTPEVIEDGVTGLLVPSRDTDALAAAIEKLAGDETLRKEMGEAGRRRVKENFTIQAHVRKTERAYTQLLGGSNGNG